MKSSAASAPPETSTIRDTRPIEGTRRPFSIREMVAFFTPTDFAKSACERPCSDRYARSLLMALSCHDGNFYASEKLPYRTTTQPIEETIVSSMVTRIGPKKPVRLFIAEWRVKR